MMMMVEMFLMRKMMYDKILNLHLFSLVQNNVLFPVLSTSPRRFTATFLGHKYSVTYLQHNMRHLVSIE
jgi:hypothetical protein